MKSNWINCGGVKEIVFNIKKRGSYLENKIEEKITIENLSNDKIIIVSKTNKKQRPVSDLPLFVYLGSGSSRQTDSESSGPFWTRRNMHMRHMHIDIIMLFTVSFFMNAFCPFSRLTGVSPVDGVILVPIIDFVKS